MSTRNVAGQVAVFSVSLLADRDDNDVRVFATGLTCGDSVIPGEFVDVFVVKVWTQSGLGVYQTEPVLVPELMLKDDRQSLVDSYHRRFKSPRHFAQPFYLYAAPAVRLTGDVNTALETRKSKQIWMRVHIPPGTPAGTFEGALVAVESGGRRHELPVKLHVCDIQLSPPRQSMGIFYRGSLGWRQSQHYVTRVIFRKQLEDIYRQGFRSITFNEYDLKLAQECIDIAEDIGFDGEAFFIDPSPSFGKLRFSRLKPIYFLSDEIDVHCRSLAPQDLDHNPYVRWHRKNWFIAEQLGLPKACTLFDQSFLKRLQGDIGCAPDRVMLYLPKNCDYMQFYSEFEKMRNPPAYYYWACHMEKPNLNRVLAGLYLWKSKAEGIFPYCYQHLPKHPYSPYDDFDFWDSSPPGLLAGPMRDHLVTYPARRGSIPTLQWEGLREGLLDLRCLTTLEEELVGCEQSGVPAEVSIATDVRREVSKFLQRIDLRTISITSPQDAEPYPNVEPIEYGQFRDLLMDKIKLLQSFEC